MGKKEFDLNQVIWAKLGTYSPWPSRITRPRDVDKPIRDQLPERPTSQHELVWFFGTHNCAWVPRSNITDYKEEYEEKSHNKKEKNKKSFILALQEAEKWQKQGVKDKKNNNDNQTDDEEDEEEEDNDSNEEEEEEEDEKRSKKQSKAKKTIKNKRQIKTNKEKGTKEKKGNETDSDNSNSDEEEEEEEEEDISKKKSSNNNNNSSGSKKRKIDTSESKGKAQKKKDNGSKDSNNTINNNKLNKQVNNEKVDKRRNDKSNSSNEENNNNDNNNISSYKTEKENKDKNGTYSRMSPLQIADALRHIVRHPVAKYYKYAVIQYDAVSATAKAYISDLRKTSKYEIHSIIGSAHYLLDLTSYVAALMHLNEGESAVTSAFTNNILGTIPQGTEIQIKATIISAKTPGIILISAEITHNGKQLSMATITKNVISETTTIPSGVVDTYSTSPMSK